jgi:hypothetical protein
MTSCGGFFSHDPSIDEMRDSSKHTLDCKKPRCQGKCICILLHCEGCIICQPFVYRCSNETCFVNDTKYWWHKYFIHKNMDNCNMCIPTHMRLYFELKPHKFTMIPLKRCKKFLGCLCDCIVPCDATDDEGYCESCKAHNENNRLILIKLKTKLLKK